MKLQWKHYRGMYLNNKFRIFKEGSIWALCDIRKGVLNCPSWEFYTAKDAKAYAEEILINYF